MSGGKMARYQSSIINRPSCGGPKKSGLAPRIGWYMQSNPTLRRAPQKVPLRCIPNTSIQTQKYGYRAVHGGNMG